MKLLQALGLILFTSLSSPVWAAVKIEGRILKSGSELFLLPLHHSQALPLRAQLDADQSTLRRLETGDYIQGQGKISDQGVEIEALYFIGLKKLLGVWRSQDWELFEFRSFEDLLLYWPTSRTTNHHSPRTPHRIKNYSYRLAPSPHPHWSMLLVDKDSVDVARVLFLDNQLYVELMDRKNGSTVHTFHLSPIALQKSTR